MSLVSDFPSKIRTLNAVIPNSGTISAAVDLVGTGLVAIQLPAAMTGTAISFQGSADGTTFGAIHDGAGAAVSITIAANLVVVVPSSITNGSRWLKLVSGSTEAAERTIKLITKAI
jgi:hypothetical protein